MVPVALALALSACGFHLRNALALPPDLGPVRVVSADPLQPAGRIARRRRWRAPARPQRRGRHATDVDDAADCCPSAGAITPISIDALGRAQEFSLRYAVIFALRRADGTVAGAAAGDRTGARLHLATDRFDRHRRASAKSSQRELRREMAAAILRRDRRGAERARSARRVRAADAPRPRWKPPTRWRRALTCRPLSRADGAEAGAARPAQPRGRAAAACLPGRGPGTAAACWKPPTRCAPPRARRASASARCSTSRAKREPDWDALESQLPARPACSPAGALVELRLPSGKPGKEGAEAHRRVLRRPAARRRCCWSPPANGASSTAASGAKRSARIGQSSSPGRSSRTNCRTGSSAACARAACAPIATRCRRLAERVEGNLLAAAQEIDKLALLCRRATTLDAATDGSAGGRCRALRRVPPGRRGDERAGRAGLAHARRTACRRRGGAGAARHGRRWSCSAPPRWRACRRAAATWQRRVQGAAHLGFQAGRCTGARCSATTPRAGSASSPRPGSVDRIAKGRARPGRSRAMRGSRWNACCSPSPNRARACGCSAEPVAHDACSSCATAAPSIRSTTATSRSRAPCAMRCDADVRPAARRRPAAQGRDRMPMPAQRARMLDLAVAGEPGLIVDRRELRRDGPSYTVDTLRELRAELGAAGAARLDGRRRLAAASCDTWHRWRELFDARPCPGGRQRPGSRIDAAMARARARPRSMREIAPRWRAADDAGRVAGRAASPCSAGPAAAAGVLDRAAPPHRAPASPGATGCRRAVAAYITATACTAPARTRHGFVIIATYNPADSPRASALDQPSPSHQDPPAQPAAAGRSPPPDTCTPRSRNSRPRMSSRSTCAARPASPTTW